MSLDLAGLAAWLDAERPGWRTEDAQSLIAWANTPSVPRRPERLPLRLLAEWAIDQQLHSALISAARNVTVQATKDRVQAILEMLRRPGDLTISASVADDLVTQMEGAGLLTATQAAEGRALGTEYMSPAEAAGHTLRCPTVVAALQAGG